MSRQRISRHAAPRSAQRRANPAQRFSRHPAARSPQRRANPAPRSPKATRRGRGSTPHSRCTKRKGQPTHTTALLGHFKVKPSLHVKPLAAPTTTTTTRPAPKKWWWGHFWNASGGHRPPLRSAPKKVVVGVYVCIVFLGGTPWPTLVNAQAISHTLRTPRRQRRQLTAQKVYKRGSFSESMAKFTCTHHPMGVDLWFLGKYLGSLTS